MRDTSIERVLRRIDGRGYKAYKDLRGAEETVPGVKVRVARVQGDPFATPSVVELLAGAEPLFRAAPECRGAETALLDLAARTMKRLLVPVSRKRGEGHSGLYRLPRMGPVMVPRSAARLRGGMLRLLVRAGLPSRGRRILGSVAREMLLEELPRAAWELVDRLSSGERGRLREWCRTWHDQEAVRRALPGMGLVAFVADGSILPRRCGQCWEPLEGAVPFESPPSLRVEIKTPYRGVVGGMGVREGLTVVAGPAFHGKTTLLEALSVGVWNHVPGDGRELVITRRDAVLVESENGRRVSCVDLRSFLRSLPGGGSTECFTTEDASGATSAAASIQEAVEAGSRLLLMDEDMLATNLLHRDVWTERFTGKKTLITVTELAGSMKRHGISIIVVASGAMPLLAEADTIIVMDEYRPVDATSYRSEAKRLAEEAGIANREEYTPPRKRRIEPPRPRKWRLRGSILLLDSQEIPLAQGNIRQLEDPGMLETALASILEGKRLEDLIEGITPERSLSRRLDAALVMSRLPVRARHVHL